MWRHTFALFALTMSAPGAAILGVACGIVISPVLGILGMLMGYVLAVFGVLLAAASVSKHSFGTNNWSYCVTLIFQLCSGMVTLGYIAARLPHWS